jgi:acetate kinase
MPLTPPKQLEARDGIAITINGGSSSVKFSVCEPPKKGERFPKKLLSGSIDKIGGTQATLKAKGQDGVLVVDQNLDATNHRDASEALIGWLKDRLGTDQVKGIGHRVVLGGFKLTEHQLITDEVIKELKATVPLDPAHLPREIALIERFRNEFPDTPQIACFDTAFHRDLPRIAQLMPIPRKFDRAGVRRFGFHGLSYTFLLEELRRQAGYQVADGKLILAHLGSGASMAAIQSGKPIDTTMGFTPTAGLVMGTRPGDLDPGLLLYLVQEAKMSTEELDDFINHQCGLIGISETTSDVEELLKAELEDLRAKEALDLFCYQATKWIGAYAAALGGLETLVFSGGIGEHSPEIRSRICRGLRFLGVQLDESQNHSSEGTISSSQSRIVVRVIPTDEEAIIAQTVYQLVT